FALLAGAAAVMFIIVNRPLRRIEALESLKEKQKTALAQKAAADAQLALRQNIEYVATPRRIIMGNRNNDQEIRGAKFKELGKYGSTPAIVLYVQEEEAKMLAFDIRAALWQSGWKHVDIGEAAAAKIPLGFIQAGVQVRTDEKKEIIYGSLPPAPPPNVQ